MGRTVINQTENKQTVILNDSPEGIEGGYFDAEMGWHELGGETGPVYEYDLSNLFKLNAGLGPRTAQLPNVIELFLDSYNRRRSYMVMNNDPVIGAMYSSGNLAAEDSYFRLIPVPDDAKKVTIEITPSTQFVGPSFYTWDPEGDGLTKQLDPGWNQGSYSLEMTPGTYQFMGVTSKYDSAGSSYPTEPTDLKIVFEKE